MVEEAVVRLPMAEGEGEVVVAAAAAVRRPLVEVVEAEAAGVHHQQDGQEGVEARGEQRLRDEEAPGAQR